MRDPGHTERLLQVGDFVLHLANPEMHVFSFITTDPAVIVLEDLHNVFSSMSWPSGPLDLLPKSLKNADSPPPKTRLKQ